ncbi:MAG TPA: ABC transporter permease [Gemmataceae bacterium]|nr:ABC transporter permease [Gemmataceae bacterium]
MALTTSLRRYAVRHSAVYLITHAPLLGRVTRTELRARYAGTLLGPAWALLGPLVLLGLYAVTYTMILRVQVGGFEPTRYVLFIFAGLVPFLATAEALNQGVSSVLANKSLLSNTVFPIDLAPVKAVLLAQVPLAVGMALILAGGAVFDGGVPWTAVLLPAVWLLHAITLVGLCWFLALFNVVLRDLQMLMAAALLALLIISPIAYTPDMVPDGLKFLVDLNPFAYFVVAYQKVLVLGQVPAGREWAVIAAVAGVSFAAGGRFFAALKKAIVDHV